jgi:flavin reductase (DIM6/NTAB) family NADH-FMN oxidoreductase RutF
MTRTRPLIDPELVWSTARRFPTGVSVVTAGTGDAVRGTTVSAFTFVSKDPALVSVSLHRDSGLLAVLRDVDRFAVNVLAREHGPLARQFASPRRTPGAAQFAGTDWIRLDDDGPPLLRGAVCGLLCRQPRQVPAGDHVLVLGEVADVLAGTGSPLLYVAGKLRPLDIHPEDEELRP